MNTTAPPPAPPSTPLTTATRSVPSPLGVLQLTATPTHLTALRLPYGPAGQPRSADLTETPADDAATPGPAAALLDEAQRQLDQYFASARTRFDLPLAPHGTDFQRRVWDQLQFIGFGQVRSYQQIAHALGQPAACRAVGLANARNPLPILIPCHRVVAADGRLTGFAGGLDAKRWLLDHESTPTPLFA